MLNYPIIYSLSERESGGKHARKAVTMQGNVSTLVRLKIVPAIKNLIYSCHLYDCEM